MENCLFIAPRFFEYEEKIRSKLLKYYNVTFINQDEFVQKYFQLYNKNKIIKIIRHFIPALKEKARIQIESNFINSFLDNINWENNYYSLVFCIKGDFIPDEVYIKLKSKNSNAKFILYEWDDISLLLKKDFINVFNYRFSYNISDCKKYNMNYLPMFIQNFNYLNNCEKKYDIAIIGSVHKKRIKIAKKIYNKYKKMFSFYIYFYDKERKCKFFSNNTPLKYEEYMDILQKSRCILDVSLSKQKGPTTRFQDAMCTKTKVITTSNYFEKNNIKVNNIYVLKKNLYINKEFVNSKYINDDKICYNVDSWIEYIFNNSSIGVGNE